MNPITIKSLLIIALLGWQTIEIGFADNPSIVDVSLPSNTWNKETNGVELAVMLVRSFDGDSPHDTINVYIKNTSSYLYRFDQTYDDLGIKLFYLDNSKTENELREYKYKEEGMMLSGKVPLPLYPGTTLLIKIKIYPKEVPLLMTNPVICSFKVFDMTNKQRYAIKSSPMRLVETVEKPPK